VLLFLAALFSSSAAGAEPSENVIVFVGDSITAGTGMPEPVGPAFPELLAQRVEGSVENLGCGGTSALDWNPRSELAYPPCQSTWRHYQDLVKPRLPATIVGVLLGTSDAGGYAEVDHAPVSRENYGRAITDLVRQLLRDGAGSILLMTPPHNYGAEDDEVDSRLRSYRDEILRVCDATPKDDIHCGPDLYTELGRQFFVDRNFHPNGKAHAWIADEILAWCRALPDGKRCVPTEDEPD
jgi:lysophospholipase L1-like esterase